VGQLRSERRSFRHAAALDPQTIQGSVVPEQIFCHASRGLEERSVLENVLHDFLDLGVACKQIWTYLLAHDSVTQESIQKLHRLHLLVPPAYSQCHLINQLRKG
jgi:hypothetical protein